VTLLLDPRREIEFFAVSNTQHHLLVGYCFRRVDFPGMAWEDNKARTELPWNGTCQARRLEFASTPFPVGYRQAFLNGPLFGVPTSSLVFPKREDCKLRCLSHELLEDFREVTNIPLKAGEIQVCGSTKHGPRQNNVQTVRVAAARLADVGLI
jgi:hypothetical protein